MEVRGGVVEIYAAASDIGQGCATVFLQILSETAGLRRVQMRNMGSSSELAPDSGTTSGSRQTLITGEAVRIAAADLKKALDGVGGDLSALEGREFFAEFFDPTDKLGADKPNPKSHVAYGFATHVVVPEGSIFVMGDNRNNSTDGRSPELGVVDERCVLGRALFVLLPFQDIGPV